MYPRTSAVHMLDHLEMTYASAAVYGIVAGIVFPPTCADDVAAELPAGQGRRAAGERGRAERAAPEGEVSSVGGNIKWRAGNEPAYCG